MLVLSRNRDEGIRIGDDVRVMVVDVRGDKVRLGVEAPAEVAVHRDEVYEQIHRNRSGDGKAGNHSLRNLITVYPAKDWHEELGDVLWWRFPIKEAPYIGSPLAGDFPADFVTHWSFVPAVWNEAGQPKRLGRLQ